MADAKISALTDGGALAAGDALAIARSGTSYRASPIGVPVLVYRYTVTGSDKASVDTGADTADAGSNDWTNGDLLEVFVTARTDKAANFDTVTVTVNNDTSSIYDRAVWDFQGSGLAGAPTNSNAAAGWAFDVTASSPAGSYPTAITLVIPAYAGTVFHKAGIWTAGEPFQTSGSLWETGPVGYRSTSAISRLKMAPSAGQKFKVGTQLLIYKRLAS